VAYTDKNAEEISFKIEDVKNQDLDDVYKYRTKQEIENRVKFTENFFDISAFDINPNLDVKSKEQIHKLLYKYRDTFSYFPSDIESFKGYVHRVRIDKAATFHQRSPSVPIALRAQLDKQLEDLLKAKIIRETNTSEFSSPMLMVRKPNSKEFRLVLNLQACNKYTRYLAIPFESTEDILNSLRGKKLISSLDISNSYFQLDLHPSSWKYMSFEVPHTRKTYQFKKCVMGHSTSAQSLSIATRMILEGLPDTITSFADDILVSDFSGPQHIQSLEMLLKK